MKKPSNLFSATPACFLSLVLLAILAAACRKEGPSERPKTHPSVHVEKPPEPPVFAPQPHQVTAPHGHTRMDPYYRLRNRKDPEVLAYLKAENEYADAVMSHTRNLQKRLFSEFRKRTRETDMSVPFRLGSYWYYTRFEESKEHRIYARRKGSMDAEEEILLDANERAESKPFYRVNMKVSSGENILAFAEDTVGRNIVTIRFKDLETGKLLTDVIEDVSWNMAWAEDNRTIFYTARDPVTLRMNKVYRHVLGSDPARAELVWEEKDEAFSTFVYKSKSRRYLIIGSSHSLTQEYRFVRADNPEDSFAVFIPRKKGHEHRIDHAGKHFYIRTNHKAKNFRIVRTHENRRDKEHWEDVIPHRKEVFVHDFQLFEDHLAVRERAEGLLRIRIRSRTGNEEHIADLGKEAAYRVGFEDNPEFETGVVRLSYGSLATPKTIYDYDMENRKLTLLKREEVLGDFKPEYYQTKRLTAAARDGARVPITLVYRRDKRGSKAEPRPLLLYGYGSYGASIDPWFSIERLSLLDRGMMFAIAHVRGGQEMGRDWYENGKLLNKRNTFYDFIDAAEHLVKKGYTTPERLFIDGISAGGLLVGAVITMQPDLFYAALARVPFVDVVTTMLDESIPLTTFEYDEWGDPRKPEFYEYMLSYSPYDNVKDQSYPHLLVTSGLHDSQVQFWEPAKWVAKLRATRTGDNRLLLKTNMEAGHGGAAGRYRRWKEIAFEYAFILDLAGVSEVSPAGP